MTTHSHKNCQKKAAGKNGFTEYPLGNGQRLDALSANKRKATEVERCGNLSQAVSRLKKSGASQRVLQVPQRDMNAAVKAMKSAGLSGTVKNMSDTKRISV